MGLVWDLNGHRMDIWDFSQPGLDAHKKPSTVGNLCADLPPRITYMYILFLLVGL